MSFKVLLSSVINVRAKNLSGWAENYGCKTANEGSRAMNREHDYVPSAVMSYVSGVH